MERPIHCLIICPASPWSPPECYPSNLPWRISAEMKSALVMWPKYGTLLWYLGGDCLVICTAHLGLPPSVVLSSSLEGSLLKGNQPWWCGQSRSAVFWYLGGDFCLWSALPGQTCSFDAPSNRPSTIFGIKHLERFYIPDDFFIIDQFSHPYVSTDHDSAFKCLLWCSC